jgi:hypothetical protein
LAYYDAGSAARFIRQPVHVAAVLFDPYALCRAADAVRHL